MAALPADPSEFAIGVGVGYGHVVEKVFGSVARASMPNSIVAALLAVPTLVAYLLVVTVAFAVRVAADGYARVVASDGSGSAEAQAAAGFSPAAVLGWFADLVVKLVAWVLFGALVFAFFYFNPVLVVAGK